MTRRVALGVGIGAVSLAGVLTACGGGESGTPSTSTTPSSSAPAPTPSEKSINPTGGNLFSPQVKAPPAPTAIPGTH